MLMAMKEHSVSDELNLHTDAVRQLHVLIFTWEDTGPDPIGSVLELARPLSINVPTVELATGRGFPRSDRVSILDCCLNMLLHDLSELDKPRQAVDRYLDPDCAPATLFSCRVDEGSSASLGVPGLAFLPQKDVQAISHELLGLLFVASPVVELVPDRTIVISSLLHWLLCRPELADLELQITELPDERPYHLRCYVLGRPWGAFAAP